jgi:hypothetical protein
LNERPNLSPDQIGILVDDIEASVPRYAAMFNVQEFRLWTYGPDFMPQMTYRDQPGQFAMRLALSDTTPQIELIQSLRGPSIYEDWLATHPPGLHHIGTFVADLESAAREMREAGYQQIQAGHGYGASRDGGFAYFDAIQDLGIITELIAIPTRRHPPETTWSAGRWHQRAEPTPATQSSD